MDSQVYATLEFDQLRALLRRGAQTPMGQAQINRLAALANIEELKSALAATEECVRLRSRGVSWTFSEIPDPSESLARLRVGGATLEPLAILDLARLCDHAMSARASILAEREEASTLWKIVEDLPRELSSMTARILNKILPSGELDDRASPELARIRHDINRLRSSITRSLESLMRRSEDAVQDELVTIRNDRFVIPIKADHRARVQGVAHGFSSSGATAFIEPMETVESNNELQGLRELEQREIFRVLTALTEELRLNLSAIELATSAVAELDFINAKAAFQQRFECVIPEISATSRRLELEGARHPLLEENLRSVGEHVVPVSFSLGDEHDSMVISGANAGGKTVVLKTTGLLSLMALSGVPVPAQRATVPFYTRVLADIGDHQSIAANLSTFTSHIANISRMLGDCEAPALVLLDEVGTGTDPEEGSALGVAVVDHFRKTCKAHVMASTHYSGLKMYAASEPGVLNASVEFDERTLRPTYRLIVGVAGASSGLEIARRFGVPDEIVQNAALLVKDSSRLATQFLHQIKNEAEEASSLREALEEERKAVAEKFASLEVEAEKRERDRQTEFRRELEEATRNFEARSSELLATISDRAERLKAEREAQRRASQLKSEVKERLRERAPVRVVRGGQTSSTAEPAASDEERFTVATPREIRVGDRVRLRTFGSIGIVDQIKENEAEIRVKSLRLREKVENLELMDAVSQPAEKSGKFARLRSQQEKSLSNSAQSSKANVELNVIGQTTDEAVDNVDKFLDEAFMSSLAEVRIVHGHGTGALRRAISDHLKNHPHVQKFLPAPPQQGGTGATLVELKY